MRDTLKNREYFDEIIEKRYLVIEKREDKFKNNLIKPERIKTVRRDISGVYKKILIAKYSRGDDMLSEDIYKEYMSVIELMYENWENSTGKYKYKKGKAVVVLDQYIFSEYLSILETISLGILLNVTDIDFNLLIKYVDRDNVKDFLFEFLFKHKQDNRESVDMESYKEFFHINERYGRLKQIIKEENKSIAQSELKYFLEKEWYQSFKDTPLYNQHKNVHNTYSGYWCFVAAAIVKIKQLDDSSFRDNQYYPIDLV